MVQSMKNANGIPISFCSKIQKMSQFPLLFLNPNNTVRHIAVLKQSYVISSVYLSGIVANLGFLFSRDLPILKVGTRTKN